MDGVLSSISTRERSTQSPHPRPQSRASTAASSSASQVTAKSSNSSVSHPPPSGRHSASQHQHKYHHTRCGPSPSPRPASRLSSEDAESLKTNAGPNLMSSFLQERLQQERRLESERTPDRLDAYTNSSTGHVRSLGRDRDSRHARSSTEDEGTPKSPMGAREVGEALEKLHKDNFALKLELALQGDRQTAVERSIKKLEKEKQELAEENERLRAELDGRDKAVNEAVAMILQLEDKNRQLLWERNMVHQVEVHGSYRHPHLETDTNATPKVDTFAGAYANDDDKVLGRMPSFLADENDQTENLRTVVLRNRGSVAHIRNLSETSAEYSEINRVASPALSVLSEGSFASVYGKKATTDTTMPPVKPSMGPASVSRPILERGLSQEMFSRDEASPGRTPRAAPKGSAGLPQEMQSLNDMLEAQSPLHLLERLDRKLSTVEDVSSRPSTSSNGNGVSTPSPSRPPRAQQHVRTKQEKREALRKVMTAAPPHMEFGTHHPLPPTPDTISTSTLRRFQQTSTDTLAGDVGAGPRSTSFHEEAKLGKAPPTLRTKPTFPNLDTSPSQRASTTAFTSRKPSVAPNLDSEVLARFNHLALPTELPRRPHSAGETTSSRPRADSLEFDSDSDDEGGGADARSNDGNLDYWMRESYKPDSGRGEDANCRPPPDLFNFPEDAGGWKTDDLFGAMHGSGIIASPVSALKRDPLDEALAAGLPTATQSSGFEAMRAVSMSLADGITPPDRRSSLNASTGIGNSGLVAPLAAYGLGIKKNPSRVGGSATNSKKGRRVRSNSIDSATVSSNAQAQARNNAQPAELEGMAGKRSQYPPITGGQSGHIRRGSRLGSLGGLFRRDRTGSESVPTGATEPKFPSPAQIATQHVGRSSVPPPAMSPWMKPPGVATEVGQSSATPPPIMRSRIASVDGEAEAPSTPMAQSFGDGPLVPHDGTPNGPQSGGRRKWLGLGRRGSLKRSGQ